MGGRIASKIELIWAFGLLLWLCITVHVCTSYTTVTCDTEFSQLNFSITKFVCPANCWKQHSTLCGSDVYSQGPVCLAAMREQIIDDSGGLVRVHKTSGRKSYKGGTWNGVSSNTCGIGKVSYSFTMTCGTLGDSDDPITKVYCPAQCRGASYSCGRWGFYLNSSVCVAAIKAGKLEASSGGFVTFYTYGGWNKNETLINNASTLYPCNFQQAWFTFEDINDCVPDPCVNGGTCVDLIGEYRCVCSDGFSGNNCEIRVSCLLGLKNGDIPDSAMTASSTYRWGDVHLQPRYGRLDNTGRRNGYWAPSINAGGQWIQITLNQSTRITGVITQGCPLPSIQQWTTQYKISYFVASNAQWKFVTNSKGQAKLFDGNFDWNTNVTNRFDPPIFTDKIRLVAMSWHNHVVVRHEYLTC